MSFSWQFMYRMVTYVCIDEFFGSPEHDRAVEHGVLWGVQDVKNWASKGVKKLDDSINGDDAVRKAVMPLIGSEGYEDKAKDVRGKPRFRTWRYAWHITDNVWSYMVWGNGVRSDLFFRLLQTNSRSMKNLKALLVRMVMVVRDTTNPRHGRPSRRATSITSTL